MPSCAYVKCLAQGVEQLDPNAITIDNPLWYCESHLQPARELRRQFKDAEKSDLLHEIRKGGIDFHWIATFPPENRQLWKEAVGKMFLAYSTRCQFQATVKSEFRGEGHEYFMHTLRSALEIMWPLLIDDDIEGWQPVENLNRKHRKAFLRAHPWASIRSSKRRKGCFYV